MSEKLKGIVIEIGDCVPHDGGMIPGLLITASAEDLSEFKPNLLYQEVEITIKPKKP